MPAQRAAKSWSTAAGTSHTSVSEATSAASGGSDPVSASPIGPANSSEARTSGSVATASAAAHADASCPSAPSSRARASGGCAITRTDPATIERTTKTPYAAKNPSVSAERPNSRATTTPTAAASPVTAASESPVRSPLRATDCGLGAIALLNLRGAYEACRTTRLRSGPKPRWRS